MTTAGVHAARRDEPAPTVADVFAALGETASALRSLVEHLLREEPTLAVVAALGAGFIAGGGLTSPLGATLTSRAFRAALANLGTFAALDLFRHGMEEGFGSPQGARAQ